MISTPKSDDLPEIASKIVQNEISLTQQVVLSQKVCDSNTSRRKSA